MDFKSDSRFSVLLGSWCWSVRDEYAYQVLLCYSARLDPDDMGDDEGGTIPLRCALVPQAAYMPMGIVCTLTKDNLDNGGLLKNRLTIRIPLWDENDIPFHKARVANDGGGIILSMPATSSFLRNIHNVTKATATVDLNGHGGRIHRRLLSDLSEQKS